MESRRKKWEIDAILRFSSCYCVKTFGRFSCITTEMLHWEGSLNFKIPVVHTFALSLTAWQHIILHYINSNWRALWAREWLKLVISWVFSKLIVLIPWSLNSFCSHNVHKHISVPRDITLFSQSVEITSCQNIVKCPELVNRILQRCQRYYTYTIVKPLQS